MIFKFLSLEMFILGQKASKTTFHKKYSIQSRNVKKAIFLRKSFILKIRVRNFYNQILGNQQVNLIARAKLGSHFRSRRVQFFNSLGIIKKSCEIAGLFDDFVARFSSLISELHSLRPPLRPPQRGPRPCSGLRSLRSYIRYENLSKNHQKSWISQLFLRSPLLKN